MGYDTTVMVRSILLRGFDLGMSSRIGNFLRSREMKFIHDSVPTKFSKSETGRIMVEYNNSIDKTNNKDEFDTVVLAVGRTANTANLGLEALGVKLSKSHKVVVDETETSSISNIYSIGDCAEGRPELTPPAVIVRR